MTRLVDPRSRDSRGFGTTLVSRFSDDDPLVLVTNASVNRPLRVHYTGPAGAYIDLKVGDRVKVLDRLDEGLSRIRLFSGILALVESDGLTLDAEKAAA
jgi:hypothetical protein